MLIIFSNSQDMLNDALTLIIGGKNSFWTNLVSFGIQVYRFKSLIAEILFTHVVLSNWSTWRRICFSFNEFCHISHAKGFYQVHIRCSIERRNSAYGLDNDSPIKWYVYDPNMANCLAWNACKYFLLHHT